MGFVAVLRRLTRWHWFPHDRRTVKTGFRTYLLAVCCGGALALSFPSWSWYPLAWVALSPLFVLGCRHTPLRTASFFFAAGWAFHGVLLQWLMTNVYWAGGWAFWGYQLLCVYLSLYWFAFGLAWSWMHGRAPKVAGAIAAALLWAGMEYLQGRLLTGFGWGALAYSQGPNVRASQWASLGGVGAVSAIVMLFSALLGLVYAEPRLRVTRIVAAVAVLAAAHGGGGLLLRPADYSAAPFRAGLFQADFPLEMKWDHEYTAEMVRNAAEKSRALAQREKADLFVWPESLVMAPLDETPELIDLASRFCRDSQCALFTGAMRTNAATGGAYNSSFYLDATGLIVDHYDKVHLAPFGEYVPLSRYFPFVGRIIPAIGDMESGNETRVFSAGSRHFGPLICFEVLFGELAEQQRAKGADFLVVITNLGWFGMSNAIAQELEIARLRAIEMRLPLVHCANSGISGVFDPWGRFELVNTVFDKEGQPRAFRVRDPKAIIMNRCAGVLPVASAGPRLLPAGPRLFPMVAGIFCGLLFLAALLHPPARERKEVPVEKR